jgi:hypothetical protein
MSEGEREERAKLRSEQRSVGNKPRRPAAGGDLVPVVSKTALSYNCGCNGSLDRNIPDPAIFADQGASDLQGKAARNAGRADALALRRRDACKKAT